MTKKIVILFLSIIMLVSLSSCGNGEKVSKETQGNNTEIKGGKSGKFQLALVTDLGTIDDKSFNQGAWEGLKKYAQENKITYKYYQPQEGTDASYLATIGLAVEGGAKLVVCPGYLFEPAVTKAQDMYPKVKFILLDATLEEIKDNVACILYAEEQAGFLAGYAAVKDGYTKLGFMGGQALPAVIRFGYGFIQGADYAAEEINKSEIEIMYHYTGAFVASPEAQSMAASWYQNGTQVIFGCGGAVGNSVMSAAKAADKKVIGVDVDQSFESETVVTSATKMLSLSVYTAISDCYKEKFPGGKISLLDASNNGVGLPMETSKFQQFEEKDYENIYQKLAKKEVTPLKDTDIESPEKVPVKLVKVEEVGE